MSTRATYRFETCGVTLYIHHDGYPAGAASYFYNALVLPNQQGTGPEQMLRANPGAEVTEGHEAHGDTEYRYDVSGRWSAGARVVAQHRTSDDRWVDVFNGTIADFMELQRKASPEGLFVENYSPFRQLAIGCAPPQWMNAATAQLRIGPNGGDSDYSILRHLLVWRTHEWSGNWHALVSELVDLLAAFPELQTQEHLDLIALKPNPLAVKV